MRLKLSDLSVTRIAFEAGYESVEAFARAFKPWIPRHDRELRSSPCFEVYLNDPNSTDAEDLITDIYAPLESKNR